MVGESGCGQVDPRPLVTLIEPPSDATSPLAGSTPSTRRPRSGRRLRRTVQLVFQNPYGSLNPRKRIGAILEQPLAIQTGLSGLSAASGCAR